MIGDSAKDIRCARNAGCAAAVLVRTGNGPQALTALTAAAEPPDAVCEDLKAAAAWVCRHFERLT